MDIDTTYIDTSCQAERRRAPDGRWYTRDEFIKLGAQEEHRSRLFKHGVKHGVMDFLHGNSTLHTLQELFHAEVFWKESWRVQLEMGFAHLMG